MNEQKSYVDGYCEGVEAAASLVANMDNPWEPNMAGCTLHIADAIRSLLRQDKWHQSSNTRSEWWCEKCHKLITQPGQAYGINPGAVCHCRR